MSIGIRPVFCNGRCWLYVQYYWYNIYILYYGSQTNYDRHCIGMMLSAQWNCVLIPDQRSTFGRYTLLTRALLGLWISHRLLGGGGAFERPPWSRLLVAVEKNERQRSKAREKSFGQNWGHQGSKFQNFPKRFFDNKIFNFKGSATNVIPSCLSRWDASNHI